MENSSRILFVLLFFFSTMTALAQAKYTVTIIITNNHQDNHVGEPLYITGLFNNWNPKEILVGQVPAEGQSVKVQIPDLPSGLFEYKFTRGNWETLASTAQGRLVAPLKAMIDSDTTLYASIDGWRDDFPLSTASSQVHLLDTAFYFPNLDVHRRVWIYLPKNYEEPDQRYPVIYMHDGQDLFDEATSKGRIGPLEWGVDETIDESPFDAIVIAIAHAEDIPQRQNEYFFRPNSKFPNPVGANYLEDIVKVLKPYVDQHYRTRPSREYTAMAGSSVGGLFTFYAGLTYPKVFGTLCILSPSVWLDEGNISAFLDAVPNRRAIAKQHYYFYGGGNENRLKPDGSRVRMHDDLQEIVAQFRHRANPNLELTINPEGRHGAWYWKQAFPGFYGWWQERMKRSH